MNRDDKLDFIVPVIQGDDAVIFLEHFHTCFIAVSKQRTIYSKKMLVEVKESYELIHSLAEEE